MKRMMAPTLDNDYMSVCDMTLLDLSAESDPNHVKIYNNIYALSKNIFETCTLHISLYMHIS